MEFGMTTAGINTRTERVYNERLNHFNCYAELHSASPFAIKCFKFRLMLKGFSTSPPCLLEETRRGTQKMFQTSFNLTQCVLNILLIHHSQLTIHN